MPVSSQYRIRVLPAAQQAEIELRLEGLPPGPVRLQTPTWVPGAYGFMKYGRDLFDLRAADATGRALEVTRDGWAGFRVQAEGALTLRYRAGAGDPAWGELVGLIAHDQALLLGTHLLFAPEHPGPCRVDYELPAGWSLHHPSGARRLDERSFAYPSYAALLDAPIAAGRFERRTRTVGGVPFHFVFFDRALGFEQRVEAFLDAQVRLAEACRAVFGSFPFEDYTFLFTFDPRAHWGLEHANATTIALDADLFVDDAAWARGLRVSAHELFHAWNVCRLKPAPLGRPDLDRGAFPDALWVSEGVTRYYEFLLLVRAGVMKPADLFSNVVNYHRQLASHPASRRVGLLDSSRATFLNHNRYPGSVNATIDYYDAGMLAAFDLDAALRLAGDSLDAAFADFYRAFAGRGEGFSHADAARFFGERAPGAGELLRREVEGAGGPDAPAALRALGFELVEESRPELGLVLGERTPAEIASVVDDGPAARAGLAALDVLERIDGFPFTPRALAWAIANEPRLTLGLKRGDRLLSFEVAPEARRRVARLRWSGSAEQLARLQAWLGRDDFRPAAGEDISLTAYENFHGIQKVT